MVGTSDAELINLFAQCDALQNQIDVLYLRPSTDMPVAQELAWEQARDLLIEPITNQQEALFQQICALRATTSQAHAARARTLLGWDKGVCWSRASPCWSDQLISAVIRDLVAEL